MPTTRRQPKRPLQDPQPRTPAVILAEMQALLRELATLERELTAGAPPRTV